MAALSSGGIGAEQSRRHSVSSGPERAEEWRARAGRGDFECLLAFRTSLRRFHLWSDDPARVAGLTYVRHQFLIAVTGQLPIVSDLAAIKSRKVWLIRV